MGCLILFGLPFLLAGLFALQQALFAAVKPGDRLPLAMFGVLFGLVGGGIIAVGVWGVRSERRTNALRAAHPQQPWLWNAAWSSGTIVDSSGAGTIVLYIFAAVWNAMSWPIAVMALPQARRDAKVYFVLIFPAVGLLLLWAAIYQTVRRVKFGRSTLALETLPGCVGGWLAGTIQTAAPVAEAEGLNLSLRCVRRVTTGSGKQRHTTEDVLWEDEQTLHGKLPHGSAGGSAIPVAFRIPSHCQASDDSDSRRQVIWRLRAHAAVPGADYAADFSVPVFNVDATMQPAGFVPRAESDAAKLRAPEPAQARRGDDARIQFSLGPGDRKKFLFPAGRSRAAAITITVLGLVFGGIGMGVQHFEGPMFFAIIFQVIGAAILTGAMVMWFREVELSVDPHGAVRQWRMLGCSGSRTVPVSSVSGVTYRSDTRVNDTAYYTVRAELKEGGTATLASGLLVRDAEWIAGEIAQSLGVASTPAPEPAGVEPG